jgi:hypothetical protein
MGVEMVSPFGSGTAQVPEELVDRYRENGWTRAESADGDKPKPKAPAPRAAKATTTRTR